MFISLDWSTDWCGIGNESMDKEDGNGKNDQKDEVQQRAEKLRESERSKSE